MAQQLVESVPGTGHGVVRRGSFHGQVERTSAEVLVPNAVIDKFGNSGYPDFRKRLDNHVDGFVPVGPALRTFYGNGPDGLFPLVPEMTVFIP